MPKIIQIMQSDAGLTGLGDNGVTYTADINTNEWVEWIKPLPRTVKKQGKQFKKPSWDEVREYMCQAATSFPVAEDESCKFHAYYESNGWKVGKNPMKDWKAAVRNWLKNVEKRNENSKRSNQSAAERVAAANGLNSDFTPAHETGHIQPLAFDGEDVRP